MTTVPPAAVPRVLGIAVRPAPEVAPVEREVVVAEIDRGLVGDHARSVRRGVTLLDAAAWAEATAEIGRSLPWTTRRANVLVGGVDLRALAGHRVRIGEVEVEVLGETAPCGQMDAACPGLRRALAPAWRGGVHGRIVRGGTLRVGDVVRPLDEEEA